MQYSVYAVLGVCSTQCMQYLVYVVLGVCCTWCIQHSVYAVLSACSTQCMLCSEYAVLGACCTQCMLDLVSTYEPWHGVIARNDLTLCSEVIVELRTRKREMRGDGNSS